MTKRKIRLSKISALHYFKLVFRSLLFLATLISYVIHKLRADGAPVTMEFRPVILGVVGVVFVTEMILRFFPSSLESMGCQKQFKKNY